ncbi:MAG: hypothetical protein QOE35_3787 [Actinomycetota bacterium]
MSALGGAPERRDPRIVCLLPVRNAADTLQDWLDEAARFADAVVALDDGSTDGTGAVLAAHPLVATVITNERRAGHLGWHDGRNRNRLLAAAEAARPDWIFSLDADERLDITDAAGLREFVVTQALPGFAYGFQLYRMHGGDTYDPDYEWVYRLFPFKPSHRFLNRRLDLVPVPTQIGPERWIHTTLRVKHFGDADPAARSRRVAKFREADPEGAFQDYYENLRPLGSGPFPRWRARVPELPFLLGAGDSVVQGVARPYVVCLLPARNCADLLPGWFDSIERVADAVVALDDGSTDETEALLRQHPLVVKVLTNPPRPDFGDWDDGHNRNRLLAAAAELWPTWVISVDADERIPPEDAAALRRFLHRGAERGRGYSLASFRMIDDEDHYDRLDYDAYRLFAFEPGQVFPTARLHAPPIPTAIPRERWLQTTIRMKHLVSLTDDARRTRREKFRQADPDCTWEPDYGYTTEAPGELKTWEPRAFDHPVLPARGSASDWPDELDLDGPVLTIALAVAPGQEHDAVQMLWDIGDDERVELLVATRDGYAADVVSNGVKNVATVQIAAESGEAGLANTVLDVARGDYVTFLEVGDRIEPGGFGELIDAHEAGHGVLRAGVTEPPPTAAGWASLLLAGADPAWTYVSFAREALRALGGFDQSCPDGHEAGAARALNDMGLTAGTVSSVVRQRRQAPSVTAMLLARYETGLRGSASARAVRPRAAWSRAAGEIDGAVDASRPLVAGLIAGGAAATWLGEALRRIRRTDAPG